MAGLTPAQQIKRLKEQQKEIEKKLAKAKEKQMLKIGRLADKHGLTEWDEKDLEEAFALITESKK